MVLPCASFSSAQDITQSRGKQIYCFGRVPSGKKVLISGNAIYSVPPAPIDLHPDEPETPENRGLIPVPFEKSD